MIRNLGNVKGMQINQQNENKLEAVSDVGWKSEDNSTLEFTKKIFMEKAREIMAGVA